ncbi:hypothetical protein GQ53DRAFT_850046 [Thozetella sp. PMI_491]|nr:hypothetical protein GQ53DRAFT_850046 [Thozetella sp. PMI_491]
MSNAPTTTSLPDANSSHWNFSPSLAASLLFLVLFAIATVGHAAQTIWYRKPYCIVIICSALAQTLTYIFRTLSIQNPSNLADYEAWFILILIAPLFTNAFIYMVFGRMVWAFTSDHQIWKIKAGHFTAIFVALDIVALIIQLAGAALAATSKGQNTVWTGLHTYMAGVGIQQLFIIIFCVFALRLSQKARQTLVGQERRSAVWLLGAVFIALLLITLRICFRLVEYSQGLKSTIPTQEAYQYTLDSLPMLAALYLFNLIHPGRIIRGEYGVATTAEQTKLAQPLGTILI